MELEFKGLISQAAGSLLGVSVGFVTSSKTFKIKVKNEGKRDVVDITAKFRISQRKRGSKSGEYFISQLVNLSENPPFRNVLAPEHDDGPWGLLNACVFESDPNEEALDLLQEEAPSVERRLVVDLSSADAESGSKKISRLTYSLDDVVFDKLFSKGLTIDEEEIPAE